MEAAENIKSFLEEQNEIMDNKNRMLFRILAGGYLTYLGIKMLINTFAGKTDNPVMFGGFGISFLVIGIGYMIYSVKSYKNAENAENDIDDETECPDEEQKNQLEENENNKEE